MADYECWTCLKCGNSSVIPVAMSDGVQFYSCCNEECEWYAILLLMMDDGIFITQESLIQTQLKLWKEHEQDSIQEGED